MTEFLLLLGQAASALLVLYGGYLVLIPARKAANDDEPVALGHLQNDA